MKTLALNALAGSLADVIVDVDQRRYLGIHGYEAILESGATVWCQTVRELRILADRLRYNGDPEHVTVAEFIDPARGSPKLTFPPNGYPLSRTPAESSTEPTEPKS